MTIGRELPVTHGLPGPVSSLALGRDRILNDIARGAPLQRILDAAARLAESAVPGSHAAVLGVDVETSRLRVEAAPNLPVAYVRVVEGLFADERTGAVGAALRARSTVHVEHLALDPLGRMLEPVFDELGLHAAVVVPVVDAHAAVIALFVLHLREPGPVSRGALATVGGLCDLVAVAFEARRNAERARRLTRDLAAIEALRRDEMTSLLATLTHEVLPPIETVERDLDAIVAHEGDRLTEEERAHIRRALDHVRAFERTAEGFRHFVETVERPLARSWVQPAEQAVAAWEDLAPARAGRTIVARFDSLPACWADRALVRRLLRELLERAILSTGQRSPAHVECLATDHDGVIVYTVRDDGPGQDGRVDLSRVQRVPPLASQIVERHGGRIWLRCHGASGSSVSFTLPGIPSEGIAPSVIEGSSHAPPTT